MIQNTTRFNVIRVLMLSMTSVLIIGCGSDSTPDPFTSIVTEPEQKTYALVWNDEFDGTDLNTTDNWTHDTGTGSGTAEGAGWGNNELQYYQADNTTVSGGFLTIEAREEAVGGAAYTSSRIQTQTKQSLNFGKVEIRAKLPEGKGIWPALWMLGESFPPWPQSGEIDIMEMKGSENDTIYGTIHWDNSADDSGVRVFSGGKKTLKSGNFSDQFHVFSIEWDEEQIRWYVDGEVFHGETITATEKSELLEPFFFLINIAVGGDYDGNPDGFTTFPQQMVVDYIRVYEIQP
jgi:beta-glucanase (GH16 family)